MTLDNGILADCPALCLAYREWPATKLVAFDKNIIMVYTIIVVEESINDFLNFYYMDAWEVFFSVFH